MSWASEACEALGRGASVVVRPRGGSMRGKVEDGAAVTLRPARPDDLAVGTVVLVRVNGNVFLHQIVRMRDGRLLIGNNVGGLNGWVEPHRVLGVATEVDGRPLPVAAPRTPPSRHELVDIGCNLAHRSFARDREALLARAAAAGVGTLVITGTDLRASREAAFLARGAPGRLFSTAGVHPHQAKTWDARAAAELEALARGKEVVAIGECGLDFDRNFSPPADQERCLHAQLEIAAKTGLPVFLHERAAFARFAAILAEHRPRLVGGVVHCFTSEAEALDRYLAMDLHIGITGWICDERRGRQLRELVRRIPLNRLMLETDAPFLLPPAARSQAEGGRRNEPAFLPHVLETVARARGEASAEVARATTATARAFFRLPAKGDE